MNDVMRRQYREPTADEQKQMQTVKHQADELHAYLGMIGTSRELSLAKTKLEECVMWAVKHITGPKDENSRG